MMKLNLQPNSTHVRPQFGKCLATANFPNSVTPVTPVIPGLRCSIAPEPRSWVHLWERPNPYSDDEALLLCPISEDEWVAWVAGHGEIILHREQFFSIS